MTTKSKTESFFDQAADTYVNAFKSCVHLQEEMAGKCVDLVKGWGEGEDWTKNYQDLVGQAVPNMKKAADESMKLWEKNAAKCMELLGEGFAATQATTPSDAQVRLQKLWEQSLESMRENTENVVKRSSEAMQAYADFMKDKTDKMTEAAAAATK